MINVEKEEKNSIGERTILSCERVADVSFDGLHVVDDEVQSNELVLYNQRNSTNVLHRMSEVLICFAWKFIFIPNIQMKTSIED